VQVSEEADEVDPLVRLALPLQRKQLQVIDAAKKAKDRVTR
jgi:hypothetical protein